MDPKWIPKNSGNVFFRVLVCGMLYAFYNSTKVQIKILAIVIILFNMWYALTVFASRAQVICLVFGISVAILLRRNMGIKKVITYLVFIIVAAVGMSTAYFNEFVRGMSLTTYSMGMRVKEMIYYSDLIKGHWIMGFLYVFSTEKFMDQWGHITYLILGCLANFLKPALLV